MFLRKRFDRELWIENDKKAKNACKRLFKQFDNIKLVEPKNTRKVDLELFLDGEHVANVETEIKRVWKGKQFQYNTVQFPERKKKFAELEKPTLFIMWNFTLRSYIIVTSRDLKKSPLVEVPNKYMFKGEYFFQVPIKKVFKDDIDSALEKIGICVK